MRLEYLLGHVCPICTHSSAMLVAVPISLFFTLLKPCQYIYLYQCGFQELTLRTGELSQTTICFFCHMTSEDGIWAAAKPAKIFI